LGIDDNMNLCKIIYLKYLTRRRREFLIQTGLELVLQSGSNIQIEGRETIKNPRNRDVYNRIAIAKDEKGNVDVSYLILEAAERYPSVFRTYVAAKKLLKKLTS
jgi:hypothetical protein